MKKELLASPRVVAQFSNWQSPRRGQANPENQTNDVWSWLIQTQAWPHAAHRTAGSGQKQSPSWCFCRYGQSETKLPDGTIVYIGGEHEDHYDPDFYIYNDVVIVRPNGSIEIYGYPVDVFPPTDFHSATHCGDEILIIGGLRYPNDRDDDETSVYGLRLSDFSIYQVETTGESPPWLYKHQAKVDENGQKVICTGGELTHRATKRTVENITTWEFDLRAKSWSVVATKKFQRWLLVREDESYNDLWGIKTVVRASRSSRKCKSAERYKSKFAERGHVVDANLFDSRFTPPIPHDPIEPDPENEGYRVHKILVEGVTVRFTEDSYEIAVTVEGQLTPNLLEALEQHGLETFSALEGVPYKSIHL